MKKIFFLIFLLLLGYKLLADQQSKPSRFEEILREKHYDDYHRFEVWHDKESGQEFVCAYSLVDIGYSLSCFPTGRNWK